MAENVETIDIDRAALERTIGQVEQLLGEEAAGPLRRLLEAYELILRLIEQKNTTLKKLRKILFGSKTEKRSNRKQQESTDAGAGSEEQGQDEGPASHGEESSSEQANADEKQASRGNQRENTGASEQRKGHGRNGADQYTGAEWRFIPHDSLAGGSDCPCCSGKVYEQRNPARLVRLQGQAPVGGTVYRLQRLRCNLCGQVFSADQPPEAGSETYAPSVPATLALYRYGYGIPWTRIEQLQKQVGIPLPDSTQWDLVEPFGDQAEPIEDEMWRQGAQSDLVHNDDTTGRILERMRDLAQGESSPDEPETDEEGAGESSDRTGTFTSGLLAYTDDGHRIALFQTGQNHAGENIEQLLSRRDPDRDPPMQMCDGLERNLPKTLKIILLNCLAHGRRHFVEQEENFPDEVRYVLDELAIVYRTDAESKRQEDSDEERLTRHRTHSKPAMERLHAWCREQIDEKKVEPNSGLGKAINYMLKRWDMLTRFLHKPGAPIDNNLCEQALKRVILHRKNSLFFKTMRGAEIGDRFMSIIHTCTLNNVSPLDYLTTLARHASEVARDPASWMPWNYNRAAEPQPAAPG